MECVFVVGVCSWICSRALSLFLSRSVVASIIHVKLAYWLAVLYNVCRMCSVQAKQTRRNNKETSQWRQQKSLSSKNNKQRE